MGGLLQKTKFWWDSSDRSQRMVAICGAAFLAFLVLATIFFATKPHMAPLLSGLNPADEGSVVTELTKMGINADYDDHGTIMVPSDKVAEARVKLAAANKLPTTTGFGDDAIAKLGIMNTPAVEKERLKGILEGKLAEAIGQVDGVGTARVQLVLGDDSPFVRDVKPATASVSIAEKAGSPITKEQGQTIANLVANSVPGLTLANVVVVNNKMEMLYDGSSRSSANGRIGDKLATEQSEARRRESELQKLLDIPFGPGTAVAKINLELDFDDRSMVEDNQTPSTKLEKSKTEETMGSGEGPGAGGAATSNTTGLAPKTSATGASGTYTRTSKDNDYLVNTTHTELKQSAGTLKSMSIDVIANSDKITDQSVVESIVDGYLGSKANQPNFTRKVTLLKFDTSAAKAADVAAAAGASQQKIQQIISMLPILALVVVAVMVMRQIGKATKVQTSAMALPGGGSLPVRYEGGVGGAAGNFAALPNESPADTLARVMAAADEGDVEAEAQLAAIKGISRKVDIPLEQIKKMSVERPEAVAMLIKGWLLEEGNA